MKNMAKPNHSSPSLTQSLTSWLLPQSLTYFISQSLSDLVPSSLNHLYLLLYLSPLVTYFLQLNHSLTSLTSWLPYFPSQSPTPSLILATHSLTSLLSWLPQSLTTSHLSRPLSHFLQLTHSLNHLLTGSLNHLLPISVAHSLTSYKVTHSLNHLLPGSLNHLLPTSVVHSLSYSSHTHSLTHFYRHWIPQLLKSLTSELTHFINCSPLVKHSQSLKGFNKHCLQK